MPNESVRYEDFLGSQRYGYWTKFVLALEEGVPVRLDGRHSQSNVSTAARREGLRVATRTIDGETWVCLMRPEDVK